MLWNNLHLRTRILFGYGLIIILGAALVLFLLIRTSSLNAQIRELSAEVTVKPPPVRTWRPKLPRLNS